MLFRAAAQWAFPQNHPWKLSFTEKQRHILQAITALQRFLFPKAHLIQHRAGLPTVSPAGEIFWGHSSITQVEMWMELWQGGQSSRVQYTTSGWDADNYTEHWVGCFHCHTLSLIETKCSPLWSLKLSCWVMCLGQMDTDPIFPHTMVSFFTTKTKKVQSF